MATSQTAAQERSVTVDVISVELLRGKNGAPSKLLLIGTNGVVGPPDGRYASRDGAMIIIQTGAIKQLVLENANSGRSP